MKKFINILVCFLGILQAQPQISGMVRNYSALRLNEDLDFVMVQNTFKLNFEKRNEQGSFNADLYTYQSEKNKELELNMKQLYVDLYFDNIDFRLGRQQIIWGKSDGVFITDVVSPKDLREFLLPDFTEIRQGIDALNTSYYLFDHTFSLVLSPTFIPTLLPEEGSIWKPTIELPTEFFRLDTTQKSVNSTLKNSEAFFRWSAMLSTIDFELVGAWMWDDEPSLHLSKYGQATPTGFKLDSVVVTPKYHRLAMGGGSFSTTIKGFVFKGEAGYYYDKKYRTKDPMVKDGITGGDYLHYMAGISYTLGGVDLNGQFIQKYNLDHNQYYLDDDIQNLFTLLLHKSTLRETLHLNLFSYLGLNNWDALIRPSIDYDISDGLKMIVGANIFIGNEGDFGQFDKNDMLYSKLSYSF